MADLTCSCTDCVASGGSLHIVHFGQQERLPRWFRALLRAWLARFHVEPHAALSKVILAKAGRTLGRATITPLYRGYAWHAALKRS